MANETKDRQQYLSFPRLKERGWTEALVRDFLGDPDSTRPNPYRSSAPPMRLWLEKRVEAVEQRSDFQVAAEKARRRSSSARKAAAKQRERLLEQIQTMEVSVAVISETSLRQRAIASYNDWHAWDHDDWEPASPTSDEQFLQRITVNYIRHELTTYDNDLEGVAGKVGVADAVAMIRRKVYDAISVAYPEYAEECQRQIAYREGLERMRQSA